MRQSLMKYFINGDIQEWYEIYQVLVRTGASRTFIHWGQACALEHLLWKSLVVSIKSECVCDSETEMHTNMALLYRQTPKFH